MFEWSIKPFKGLLLLGDEGAMARKVCVLTPSHRAPRWHSRELPTLASRTSAPWGRKPHLGVPRSRWSSCLSEAYNLEKQESFKYVITRQRMCNVNKPCKKGRKVPIEI